MAKLKKDVSKKKPFKDLGELIQTSRIRKGLSQREVAEKIGYASGQYISVFERGVNAPRFQKLKDLTKLLEMSPDKVIDHFLEAERVVLTAMLKSK